MNEDPLAFFKGLVLVVPLSIAIWIIVIVVVIQILKAIGWFG